MNPVWCKNSVDRLSGLPFVVVCQNSAERLRGPLVVVVQHPAEPFATLDASSHVDSASLIVDQLVADPLMIPLDVVVLHVFTHSVAQMPLSDRNDLRQTLGLD